MIKSKRGERCGGVVSGIILYLLAMPPFAVAGWDWPLKTPDVAQSFLSPYQGEHNTGVLLTSRTSTAVRTADPGGVVFTAPYIERPHRIRPAHVLGGMVIVEHRNRLRTIYANVRPLVESGGAVTRGHVIARIDNRRGDELQFIAVDETQQSFLNPLLLFPRLDDRLRPAISAFISIFRSSPVLGEYFNVHVGVFDRRVFAESVTPTLPPYVSVRYQSQEHKIFLGSVQSDGHHLYLTSNRIRPRDLFTVDGRLILGPFLLDPAREIMEIEAIDYNQQSRAIRGTIYE